MVATKIIAVIAGLLVLPRKTADSQEPDLKIELRALLRPALWLALATTAATTAAYMGTFGYLGALLLDVSGLPQHWLPAVLTLFGVGAFIGLTTGGKTADRSPFTTLVVGILGLILISAAIALLASSAVATVALVFMLGVAGFLLNPAVWARVYIVAPDAPMMAGAMNSSAFQAGLTLAPVLAGFPLSVGHELPTVGWVGAVIGVAALGLAFLGNLLRDTPASKQH